MSFARSSHACAALGDGRILVVGGVTLGGGETNSAELYSPASDSWTIVKPARWARSGHAATLARDGRILITGGERRGLPAGAVEVFDPAQEGFETLSAGCTVTYSGYTRRITFAGYEWAVKNHSSRAGPGPNFFSNSSANVWVDAAGRLHLRITRRGNRWYCAEVISTCTLGYGAYKFYLDSPVDNLDPNVVLGLFTWSDNPDQNHRELDTEFSRWGNANNLNAQYVVQPYDLAGHTYRFQQPAGWAQSLHSFLWSSGSVLFQSWTGAGGLIDQHTFTDGIATPGGENARMNLWLFRGRAPTNRQEVEVIISGFQFVPAL
jgi:hypothetical protein